MSEASVAFLADLIGMGPFCPASLEFPDPRIWTQFVEAGAARKVGVVHEIPCTSCDEAHLCKVEWWAETGGYSSFCSEEGFKSIPASELELLELSPGWWLEKLAAAIPVERPQIEALVQDKAWNLGNAYHGNLECRVLAAVGPIDHAVIEDLLGEIESLPPAKLTIIICFASRMRVPLLKRRKIWSLRMADFVEIDLEKPEILSVNRQTLTACLRGFAKGQNTAAANRSGRPSPHNDRVQQAIAEFIAVNGKPSNQLEAARKIRSHLYETSAGEIDIAVSTIRNRLMKSLVPETA